MDAAQRLAVDDAIRQTLTYERHTLAALQSELDDLRAEVDVLAGRVGYSPTEHEAREVSRLHRLGLSNQLISVVVGRSKRTVERRTSGLPAPARVVDRDGVSKRHPRTAAGPPAAGRTVDGGSGNGHLGHAATAADERGGPPADSGSPASDPSSPHPGAP